MKEYEMKKENSENNLMRISFYVASVIDSTAKTAMKELGRTKI